MFTLTATTRDAAPACVFRMADIPLYVWCLLAAALFGLPDIIAGPSALIGSYFDSDDATRMLEVREFLGGRGWFDNTIPGLGGSESLVSHWSRLVDAPIAALVAGLSSLAHPSVAEATARIVWPLLTLAALLYTLARFAGRHAGTMGALIALALSLLCFSGTVQFVPGRIDHHNVLILCAVSGVLGVSECFAAPRTGWLAGTLLGLGVAIGYEALALSSLAMAAAGFLSVMLGVGRSGIRRAALAFAVTVAVAFFATVPPWEWLTTRCDALSLNLVVLASTAAIGLSALLHYRPQPSLPVRLVALAGIGATALAVYATAAPKCLAGPFAEVEPGVWPIWLAHVLETNGIAWLFATVPALAVGFIAYTTFGVAAAVYIARKDRDAGALFLLAAVAVAVLLSLWQAKLMPYAAFLATAPLAIAIARVEPPKSASYVATVSAMVALLNQKTVMVLALVAMGSGGAEAEAFQRTTQDRRACLTAEAIRPLAALPAGLALTEVDLGPFVAADTSLRAFSAPYHRLDRQIIETQAIFISGADAARARLSDIGARYIVSCPALALMHYLGVPPEGSLRKALLEGRPPDYLEPVALVGATPLKVWRMRSP